MGSSDPSEKDVNNTVMTPEFENKLAKVVAAAEDHTRYQQPSTLATLERVVSDREVQNWLDTMRQSGRAPSMAFPRIDNKR